MYMTVPIAIANSARGIAPYLPCFVSPTEAWRLTSTTPMTAKTKPTT